MQLNHEIPDFAYAFRAVGDSSVLLEDREHGEPRTLVQSFALTPHSLLATWAAPAAVRDMTAEHLAPVLALKPELVILGTGRTQQFPPTAVMAACLTLGIGIEVMDNPAAARTFNLLAGEGRNVAAAILLPG